MAIDVQTNRALETPPRSKIEWLMRSVRFWTRDVHLVPLGYQQYAVGAALAPSIYPTTVGAPFTLQGVPGGAETVILNVEGDSVRYIDSGRQAGTGYGMLYAAGTTFQIKLRDIRSISLCPVSAATIVNVSYYSHG